MSEAAIAGKAPLQQVAAGAAAALLRAHPLPAAAAASLRADLFPGACCYLALAVSDGSALLLSANLLAPAGRAAEPAGVHTASRCWAGAAIAARRPMAYSLPLGSRNGECSQLARHTDLAAAAQRWRAGAFLCLPFHVPPAADVTEASSSSSSSSDGGSAAALLLGIRSASAAGAAEQQQQQQQQQREHVRAMLSLAAAIVQHAAPELRQAAEALALLRPHLTAPTALQPEQLEGIQEGELEGWDDDDDDEGAAATTAGAAGVPEAAEAAGAGGTPGSARAGRAAELAGAAAAGELTAGSSRQARAGPAAPQDVQPVGTSQQPAAGPAANERMHPAGAAFASGSRPSGSGSAPPGLQGAAPQQQQPPGAQQQRQQQQQQPPTGRQLPFLARVHQVLLLCWLSLRELLALPATRRSLGLDVLLRFRGPAAPPAVAFHGEIWGMPGRGRGRSLEEEFAEHHSRVLADKVGRGSSAACVVHACTVTICACGGGALGMNSMSCWVRWAEGVGGLAVCLAFALTLHNVCRWLPGKALQPLPAVFPMRPLFSGTLLSAVAASLLRPHHHPAPACHCCRWTPLLACCCWAC